LLYKVASVEQYLDIRHQNAARLCSKMRGCLRIKLGDSSK
jgi:translation initiation factor IF-1